MTFQINANFQINQLKNIFEQDNWNCSFISPKNLRSPSQNSFRNIHFLIHFHYLPQWMRCPMFEKSTNLLVIYQYINIFTSDTLYPSIIWKKNLRSPSHKFFESSTFYNTWVRFVIFQMLDLIINQLIKYFYKIHPTSFLHFKKHCALHRRFF